MTNAAGKLTRFTGFWDEDFDGWFNAGVLVISPVNFEQDESHPLVGQWNSEDEVKAMAETLGIDPDEIKID